ncbi:hypothetical protein CFP56_020900 [Quercus suber]|uniref:Uncharacterized protein n=1 Tax=Quercus suber TaxID=58331 RepID=A0AAW0KEE7_QUESU
MRNEYGDIFVKDSFVAFKIMAIAIYLIPIRQRLSLIRKQKRKQRRLITEGNGLCLTLEFRHAFCLV